jgi:RHS repeat-associated protein
MGQNETYGYDAADRLRRVDIASPWGPRAVNYAYDPMGNLTTKSDAGPMVYGTSYSNSRALLSAGTVDYTYDENGNVTSRDSVMGTTTIAWDGANNPASISAPEENAEFLYDAGGKRLRKSTDQGSEWNYYGVYSRHDTVDGIKHHYRIMAGNRAVAELSFDQDAGYNGADPFKIEFILPDERNSPNVISDANGGVEQRMAWDVYGRKRDPYAWWNFNASFENETDVTVGFTGHVGEEDAGMIWMESRHYDSHAGRFVEPDTIVANPKSTQGWARYVYVENDPVNYTDPTGHRRHRYGDAGWELGVNLAHGTPGDAFEAMVMGMTSDPTIFDQYYGVNLVGQGPRPTGGGAVSADPVASNKPGTEEIEPGTGPSEPRKQTRGQTPPIAAAGGREGRAPASANATKVVMNPIKRRPDKVDKSKMRNDRDGQTEFELKADTNGVKISSETEKVVEATIRVSLSVQVYYRDKGSKAKPSDYGLGPTVGDHEEGHAAKIGEYVRNNPYQPPNIVGMSANDAQSALESYHQEYINNLQTYHTREVHCTGVNKRDC